MSYTPQTWNTGDIITADKLNHMENGIAGVARIVNINPDALPFPTADGHNSEGTVTVGYSDGSGTMNGVHILGWNEDEVENTIYSFVFTEHNELYYYPLRQTTIANVSAAPSSATGVCLAEDTKILILETSVGDEYFFFPSSAKFVYREVADAT